MTSARVGIGLVIIDSIIWVAVITARFTGAADQFLLNADQFRIADFDAEVATGKP